MVWHHKKSTALCLLVLLPTLLLLLATPMRRSWPPPLPCSAAPASTFGASAAVGAGSGSWVAVGVPSAWRRGDAGAALLDAVESLARDWRGAARNRSAMQPPPPPLELFVLDVGGARPSAAAAAVHARYGGDGAAAPPGLRLHVLAAADAPCAITAVVDGELAGLAAERRVAAQADEALLRRVEGAAAGSAGQPPHLSRAVAAKSGGALLRRQKQALDYVLLLRLLTALAPPAAEALLIWEDDTHACPGTFDFLSAARCWAEFVRGGYGLLKVGMGGSGLLVRRAAVPALERFLLRHAVLGSISRGR